MQPPFDRCCQYIAPKTMFRVDRPDHAEWGVASALQAVIKAGVSLVVRHEDEKGRVRCPLKGRGFPGRSGMGDIVAVVDDRTDQAIAYVMLTGARESPSRRARSL